jgi:hypothetical protein
VFIDYGKYLDTKRQVILVEQEKTWRKKSWICGYRLGIIIQNSSKIMPNIGVIKIIYGS